MQIGNWEYRQEQEMQEDKYVTWHQMVNLVNGFSFYLNIHWTNHQPSEQEVHAAFDQYIIDQTI